MSVAARRLTAADHYAKPLPDGGYLCNYWECDAKGTPHSHCECGLPRRPDQKLCHLCAMEDLNSRTGRRRERVSYVSSEEFIIGFARALTPSRDR